MACPNPYETETIAALSLAAILIYHPADADKKDSGARHAPELHSTRRGISTYIEGWLSDGESPIATEINLDAVEMSTNQFQPDEVQQEDGWFRAKGRDAEGFVRYRITEHTGNHYKVDYQENGGGSLTTLAKIELHLRGEARTVRVDGKAKTIRVLRVLSIADKPYTSCPPPVSSSLGQWDSCARPPSNAGVWRMSRMSGNRGSEVALFCENGALRPILNRMKHHAHKSRARVKQPRWLNSR